MAINIEFRFVLEKVGNTVDALDIHVDRVNMQLEY